MNRIDIVPLPPTPNCMLPDHKKKAIAAIKRLNGLTKKLETMIDEDDYCPNILEQVLAMQGHMKHIQGLVLESHLHTCAPKQLGSKDEKAFIEELIKVIGLSKR
jgi:DNA-binding FrmR family transcriptional regulator